METNRPQATSLRMAEPSEMAGNWTVSAGGRACAVTFGTARVESANAYAIEGVECLTTLLPTPVAGWRPAPDGIELAGADRRTLVSFADQGDGTGVATLSDGPATLRRAR